MNAKSVLVAVFILLLTLATVEASLVDLVSANFMPFNVPAHNIEITVDGNVTGTDNIERNGTVYTFRGNISGSIVVLCDGITINGNGYTLQGNGYIDGIFLEGRKMVTITNMTIANFTDGVVYSYYQGWNDDCRDNVLSKNNITNNVYGVYCYIPLNITISKNIISNNSAAGVSSFLAKGILIYGNTFSGNGAGVQFGDCDNDDVCGNNFINNTSQVSIDSESKSGLNFGWSTVTWSQGGLGNFWSDYTGVDANHDGIGDTPYIIDANNTDNYPVMASIDISNIPNTPPSPTLTPSPSPSPTPSISPSISILSPENTSYAAVYDPYIDIPLTFETNASLSWVGYSLDGGTNITVSENGTSIEIPASSRNLTLYANDTAGNWETPQTVYYEIAFNLGPAPVLGTILTDIAVILAVVIGLGLLVYFWKRRKKKNQ